jgi:hypothetical protein
MVSTPAIWGLAEATDMKPVIGRVRSLLALRSCSTMWGATVVDRDADWHDMQVDCALVETARRGHLAVGGQPSRARKVWQPLRS